MSAGLFANVLRSYWDLLDYHRRHTESLARHDVHNVFEKALRDLRPFGVVDLTGKRVLDLGCGQRFPFSLLAASRGAEVTALDLNLVEPQSYWSSMYRTARANGAKRAAMTAVRRLLFDRQYYAELARAAGYSLAHARAINFVTADACESEYNLPTSHFDLVVSNAVLEHVQDVNAYAIEVARVLKPEGHFYGRIHNYYSISGGHNLQWAYPDACPATSVPPWDHLRANLFPAHVYLNRLRPEEYQGILAKHLTLLLFEPRDVNHDAGGQEGKAFLEGQVTEELSSYDADLLLTRAWCVVGQPRAD